MKYGRLVVFIRQDSAEIWGFRYGLTHTIGTQKNMSSSGVFVRVVCAFRRSIKNCPSPSSMILAFKSIIKATAAKRWAMEGIFIGEQRTKQTERQPIIVVDLMKLNT